MARTKQTIRRGANVANVANTLAQRRARVIATKTRAIKTSFDNYKRKLLDLALEMNNYSRNCYRINQLKSYEIIDGPTDDDLSDSETDNDLPDSETDNDLPDSDDANSDDVVDANNDDVQNVVNNDVVAGAANNDIVYDVDYNNVANYGIVLNNLENVIAADAEMGFSDASSDVDDIERFSATLDDDDETVVNSTTND